MQRWCPHHTEEVTPAWKEPAGLVPLLCLCCLLLDSHPCRGMGPSGSVPLLCPVRAAQCTRGGERRPGHPGAGGHFALPSTVTAVVPCSVVHAPHRSSSGMVPIVQLRRLRSTRRKWPLGTGGGEAPGLLPTVCLAPRASLHHRCLSCTPCGVGEQWQQPGDAWRREAGPAGVATAWRRVLGGAPRGDCPGCVCGRHTRLVSPLTKDDLTGRRFLVSAWWLQLAHQPARHSAVCSQERPRCLWLVGGSRSSPGGVGVTSPQWSTVAGTGWSGSGMWPFQQTYQCASAAGRH